MTPAASGSGVLFPTAQSLGDQLAELKSFLFCHVEKLSQIRAASQGWDRERIPSSIHSPGLHDGQASEPSSKNVPGQIPPSIQTESTIMQSSIELSRMDDHSLAMDKFLHSHLGNIDALRRALHHDHIEFGNAPGRSRGSDFAEKDIVETRIQASSQQFSVIVVFSTFATGLIIAWLQLMHDVLPVPDEVTDPKIVIHYQMGFGFGFTGVILNLAIVMVAAADIAACASGKAWRDPEGIRARFVGFVLAQFIGAVAFGGSIGLLLYSAHSGHVLAIFPIIIFPVAVLIAGLDLASTSSEFRSLKADTRKYFAGLWGRLLSPLRHIHNLLS